MAWSHLRAENLPETNSEQTALSGVVVDSNTGECLGGVIIRLPDGSEVYTRFDGTFSLSLLEGFNELHFNLPAYKGQKLLLRRLHNHHPHSLVVALRAD